MDLTTPVVPLSAQQEALWRLYGAERMPATQCMRQLAPAFDAAELRARVERLVARHAVLRAVVGADGGARVIVVRDCADLDFGEHTAPTREHLETIACTQREAAFDVRERAQLRVALVRGGDASWLILAAPAIFLDSSSAYRLACELGDDAGANAEAPRSYLDYCLWQSDVVGTDAGDPAAPSWVPTERGVVAALRLPYACEPAAPAAGCVSARAALPRAVLARFCSAEALDAESVLFAAFAGFLAKLARLHTLPLDYVADGRSLHELQSCIGLLAKTLPANVEVPASATLAVLARRARDLIDAIVDWQDTFDVLDPALQTTIGAPRVAFEYLRESADAANADAAVVRACIGTADAADLKLAAQWEGEEIALTIVCRRGVFEAEAAPVLVQRFAEWTARLLSAERAVPMAELALLQGADADAALAATNPPADFHARGVSMQDLFAERVCEAPDAIAVVERDAALSYRALAGRSAGIAERLRAADVRAGDVVAVYLPRSTDLLAAMLAVHALGAAYLLLDVQQPSARVAGVVRDAGARAVLTRAALAEAAEALGVRRVDVDAAPHAAYRPLSAPLEGTAYILYTSGSSGRPKGVTVSHRGLAGYLQWAAQHYAADERTRAIAHTSPAVDLGITSLLMPLIAGGSVQIVDDEEGVDGLFRALTESDHVGFMKMTPTHAAMLLGHLSAADYAPQKFDAIVVGGESLNYEQLAPWLVAGHEPLVVNEYGPTEATVACCAFDAAPGPRQGRVPIGRPIAGARLYVVDAALAPLPAGVSGELLIGGSVLADGYRGQPAATAAAFVPDPYAANSGARAYRSGDLVVADDDGQLAYLGRLDRQVKIRGHRIELGEIETLLQRHADVGVAAIELRSVDGDARIVAYVTPKAGAALTTRALRDYCKDHLTAQMLPGDIVLLERMPLTGSGKIDRRALAQAAPAAQPGNENEYVPARDELESALVAIWEAHVGRRRIGVRDNFFDLGGHSMLAIRILFEVRRSLRREIDLIDIFDQPTIEALAARIRARGASAGAAAEEQMPIEIESDPANRYEPFTLTDVQQAYWVGQTDAYALGNVGAHVYQETEFNGLDLALLQTSFRKLIARHDMLRAVILPDGRQRVLAEVPDYEIEIFDLRGQPPEQQRAFVAGVRERMSHEVFELTRWPLFAVSACLIDEQHLRLHLSFDALIADAWSFEILLRDFSKLYAQPDAELPPLNLLFRDYVQATAGRPDSALFLRAKSYWADRIATLPAAPQLPMIRQLRDVVAPKFERRRHIVPEERWSRIKKRAASAGATPSALMLTAFAEVLSRWSKNQSFTLVLTVFNRPPLHPDIDEIMGDFTSLVLLEFHPSTLNFEQRVLAVQKQLMERLEHRYFSGVRVLRELARLRADKSTPLMPVVFTSTLTHKRTEEAAFLKEQQVDAMGINQTPQVYLDHQLVEQNGELQFNWDSVDELFPPHLLDTMFERYCAFVDSLAEEQPWQCVPDLLPSAVHAAYRALNDTAAPPADELAVAAILRAAARAPQNPALITPSRELSYGELVAMAWQVARALRRRGALPGQVVGVLLEKGWEQVVAVLGIVFAGAAYVPLDPQAPTERIDYMMGDTALALVLTRSELRRELGGGVQYLLWDEPSWFASEPATPLALVQTPRDLLYVIYTSGSTGRPKGVMIEHRSVVNRMNDIRTRFALAADDRAIGLTALHHDLSVFDIFGMLGSGGALVMPSAPLQRDPGHWLELLTAHRVTMWNSVPAFLGMFIEFHFNAGRGERVLDGLAPLRILLSGDKVPLPLLQRAQPMLPQATFYSLGGPTETTVWDIWNPIGDLDAYEERLPYGRPLHNARYYVLDEAGLLCPLDVPGELCIAGDGLARGYWNDAERTAAKFVAHAPTGERLYRSGDLGCLRESGLIDILGRIDLQVKIQGQRIELEEIELALQRHPAVRLAAVSVKSAPDRGAFLVAYVEVAQAAEEGADAAPGSVDEHGTMLNAIERIQFKMDQRGIRSDLASAAEHIDLARPELDADYLRALMRRRAQRHFEPTPIASVHIGGFLGLLMQVMPAGFAMPKYHYPSAGNAYPLQFYLLVREGRVEGVRGGAYYYHPRDHRLIRLSAEGAWDDGIHAANNVPVSQEAAFSLFVVCEMAAMRPLYGKHALEFGLLEAGYVGQLLMSRAPDFQMGLCPVGTMEFDALRTRFALADSHQLLHGFLAGAVAEAEFSDPKLYLTDASKKWTQPAGANAKAFADFLQVRLPQHMIPDRFVVVPQLPLTSNGKVDRAALDGFALEGEAAGVFVEPETPLQQALAGLWTQVLGVERVGLHDDFFRLGGDSILAIQLMNRLKASFATDIPLRDVLAATTVEQLAVFIERKLAAELDEQPATADVTG